MLAAGVFLLVGCGSGSSGGTAAAPSATSRLTATVGATTPATGAVATAGSPATSRSETGLSSGSPTDRVAPGSASGVGGRSLTTVDLLPPPTDGRFHSTIEPVPLNVMDRSTWSILCPVALDDLRYLTVSFRGFDGHAHTGELLVNRAYATDVVTVFRQLFAAGWPIEEMRIVTAGDFVDPNAADADNTSAFACRPVTGQKTAWSLHAYGLAIDLNPLQNPYVSGRTLIPSQARAYVARNRRSAGMNTPGSLPVRSFRAIGWGWGGTYTSKKDYMHFSSTGG
jgi:hypothetical protein